MRESQTLKRIVHFAVLVGHLRDGLSRGERGESPGESPALLDHNQATDLDSCGRELCLAVR